MRANAMVRELSSACEFCSGELVFNRIPLSGTVEARCAACGRRAPVRTRRPALGSVVLPIERIVRLAEQRSSVSRRIFEQLPVGAAGTEPPPGALMLRQIIDAVGLSSGSVSGCLGLLQRQGRVLSAETPRLGKVGPRTVKLYWRAA